MTRRRIIPLDSLNIKSLFCFSSSYFISITFIGWVPFCQLGPSNTYEISYFFFPILTTDNRKTLSFLLSRNVNNRCSARERRRKKNRSNIEKKKKTFFPIFCFIYFIRSLQKIVYFY